MSLVPWKARADKKNPFHELEALNDQLSRFFNLPTSMKWPEFSLDTTAEPAWTPAIDVLENKDSFQIKADMPGMDKKDITVAVDGDILTIKGQKTEEKELKENGVVRKERAYGSFYRSVSLPQSVDATKVKASYKNGVLELLIPKKEEAKPKQIEIDVN